MAGLMCSFDVIGDLGFPPFARAGNVVVDIDYSEGTEVFLDSFYNTATDLVPVDTGALRDSIWASGGDTFVECYAEEYYASFVEFGTWKMAAQPYFIPALEGAFAEALDAWTAAVEDAEQQAEEEYLAELEAQKGGAGGGGGFGGFLGLLIAAIIIGIIEGFMSLFTNPGGTSTNRDFGGVDISSFVEEI